MYTRARTRYGPHAAIPGRNTRLARRVTGRTLADYLEEKIWRPLGTEHDAVWVIDREGPDGVERAGCCLDMALRDWARFGALMAQDGVHASGRLRPVHLRTWIRASRS